ncbi:uncharacterized protein, partial [Halyomorpha halys]|uniref:uncharacterized protein n=1 Tax=Halyomorpha halys TaxID=286706 RepID=UPI000D0C879B
CWFRRRRTFTVVFRRNEVSTKPGKTNYFSLPLFGNAGNEDSDSTNDGRFNSEVVAQLGPPKKKGDISEELMEMACKHLNKPLDEYDTIAAAWAIELKKMKPSQQLFAKKAINDILFEGQMGLLCRDSIVINAPNPSSRISTPLSSQSLPDMEEVLQDPIFLICNK